MINSSAKRLLVAKFEKFFPALSLDMNYLRRYHNFERDIWQIPNYCSINRASVDVGVNMGIFSRWMAKHSAHVHSFECNPNLVPIIERVLPKNVTLHQVGLSDRSGVMTLRFDPMNTGIGTVENKNSLNDNSGIGEICKVEVPVQKLDEFDIREVSFMKIDVEGHELSVLKGARKLIQNNRPALLIEVEERHCPGNLEAVPSYLRQFGYEVFFLNRSGEMEQVFDIARVANMGINNFWFLASEYPS